MSNIWEHSPYEIFVKCGGVYKSPEDRDENYLGPLVAYGNNYTINGDTKNYVGFYYYNTILIEQSPEAIEYFSHLLAETIKANLYFPSCNIIAVKQDNPTLATATADKLLYPISFFEKKLLKIADIEHGKKEESFLFYDRQNIQFGGNYIIFEGVCNNFFTTKQMIDLIESAEGNVVAIVCIINSSKKKSFYDIPILSVVHIPTPQYQQDDPSVKKLMDSYNIVWEPEKFWSFLQDEMRRGVK